MCGRYATTRSAKDLSKIFEAFDDTEGVRENYNVAPTEQSAVVRVSRSHDGRVLSLARWGLLPPWATDARAGARMINARAETVATSRAYAPSFAARRCLVPADGWYEWTRGDGRRRQAWFMTSAVPVVFAGLWTPGRFGLSYSIITTAATGDLARIHDRMPLLLPAERWDRWLSAAPDETLLAAPGAGLLDRIEIRPVGPAVGDVRNNGPDLVAAAPAVEQGALFE